MKTPSALMLAQYKYPGVDWFHSLLVAASECRDDLASLRANYLTARQLSLDLNLPGEVRRDYEAQLEAARDALIAAI